MLLVNLGRFLLLDDDDEAHTVVVTSSSLSSSLGLNERFRELSCPVVVVVPISLTGSVESIDLRKEWGDGDEEDEDDDDDDEDEDEAETEEHCE